MYCLHMMTVTNENFVQHFPEKDARKENEFPRETSTTSTEYLSKNNYKATRYVYHLQ